MPNIRKFSVKLIALGGVLTLLLLLFTLHSTSTIRLRLPFSNKPPVFGYPSRIKGLCTPEAFATGEWAYEPKSNLTKMTKQEDALPMAGFEGCASSREFYWHLASDKEEQWTRFPNASSYTWKQNGEGNKKCKSLVDPRKEDFVRHLVEQGGWLLVGDSVTENHFFSLSCMLYPHVIATPNYTPNSYFDRAWPQNIYLNPKSSLINTLRLPTGFSITETPLVTFRRIDLLFNETEITDIHKRLYNPPADYKLFSNESVWSMSPHEYLDIFTTPLPKGNYGTMVVSSAGHWTTTVLSGYRDESIPDEGYGIQGVLKFFKEAMTEWANIIQSRLDKDEGVTFGGSVNAKENENGENKRARMVVVRAYLPGHEDCHNQRMPLKTIKPFDWKWYNWPWIKDFNTQFESALSPKDHPFIHYLPIDTPGRLRPDAHSTGDCLHIMTGSGVMEGWSHYIWHFISREITWRPIPQRFRKRPPPQGSRD